MRRLSLEYLDVVVAVCPHGYEIVARVTEIPVEELQRRAIQGLFLSDGKMRKIEAALIQYQISQLHIN